MDKYEEALERAKQGLPIDEIFPELKESEDERIKKEIIDWMKGGNTYKWQDNKDRWIAYLERQKEPLTPEEKMNHPLYLEGFDVGKKVGEVLKEKHPAEWSEEDELKMNALLKSLRPQPKKELSIEKAIQWLDDTFCFLDNSSGRGRDYEITTHDFDSLEEMYDSFRKAVTVDSQPHWKPSEEQMDDLNFIITALRKDYCDGMADFLASLYHDLQKLL